MTLLECVCAVLSPSGRDVLRSVSDMTVCTDAQCFADHHDAFGVVPVASWAPPSVLLGAAAMALGLLAVLRRPQRKPWHFFFKRVFSA